MSAILSHGSLALMFVLLVAGGLGLPFPEDVVLLSAGALSHRHVVWLPYAALVCASGVLTGDYLLFSTAKRLGPRALDRPLFRRLLSVERRAQVERMFAQHGGKVVFVARHVAGLRAPTFALAGIHGMPTARFLFWDALGLCISAPAFIGLGYLFSDHLDELRRGLARAEHLIVGALVIAVVCYSAVVMMRRRRVPTKKAPAPTSEPPP
jgi:membrane protein DedA with SNARE-associated domain